MLMASAIARPKANDEPAFACVFVGVESLIVPGTPVEPETITAMP
jgi:hypothetical protein